MGKDFAITSRMQDGRIVQLNDPEDLADYRREIQGGIATMYHGGEVTGPGTGTSDSVPARLSDGEFVMTAAAVRGAGGGDRDIGAARMYDMMAELEASVMAVASQQVTTRLPEFQEQYIADLLTSAQNLFKPVSEGGKGLSMPFVQQQLAGLSEGQQQAISSALSGVGAYQPFLQQAQTGLTGAMQTAAGAGMDPNAYKEYMDPYLDDVVQRAQDDIGRQGQQQQKQASDAAVRQGAFGGSRAAVLQGQIGRNTWSSRLERGASSQRRVLASLEAGARCGNTAASAGTTCRGLVARYRWPRSAWSADGWSGHQHTAWYRRTATAASTARPECCAGKCAGAAAASVPAAWLLGRHLPWRSGTATTDHANLYTAAESYVSRHRPAWRRLVRRILQ